jgi:alanine-glyoxylate transaminase/serine-glyoxylate transaminase/serine-pyruvate transaminase
MSFQNPVFIPGPTNMPDALRKACDMPTLDHRSPLFGEILQPALSGVKKILKSELAEVFIFPSTGTGGWETVITNTLSPGDKVLAARNGMFSHRWIDLCQRHGLDVVIVDRGRGAKFARGATKRFCAPTRTAEIKAVLATHNETATGVLNRTSPPFGGAQRATASGAALCRRRQLHRFDGFPDGRVGRGCRRHRHRRRASCCPQALPSSDFRRRRLPPWKPGETAADLLRHSRHAKILCGQWVPLHAGGGPPQRARNTAATCSLSEGLDAVFARHHRIADGVRAAVSCLGASALCRGPRCYSRTPSARSEPPRASMRHDIVTHAAGNLWCCLWRGPGEVAGKVFRIGHLGMPHRCHDAFWSSRQRKWSMADLGLDIKLGSGVAAAQDFTQHRQSRPWPQRRPVRK